MKENMTTNNKPAFEIFVVREGSNKKSYFTKIGAAWPTKSGSGYNADLIALPVDGKFIQSPCLKGNAREFPDGGGKVDAGQCLDNLLGGE